MKLIIKNWYFFVWILNLFIYFFKKWAIKIVWNMLTRHVHWLPLMLLKVSCSTITVLDWPFIYWHLDAMHASFWRGTFLLVQIRWLVTTSFTAQRWIRAHLHIHRRINIIKHIGHRTAQRTSEHLRQSNKQTLLHWQETKNSDVTEKIFISSTKEATQKNNN